VNKLDFHSIYARFRPLIVDKAVVGRTGVNVFDVADVMRAGLGALLQGLCFAEWLPDCLRIATEDPEDARQWNKLAEQWSIAKPLLEKGWEEARAKVEEKYKPTVQIILALFVGLGCLLLLLVLLVVTEKTLTIRKRLREAALLDELNAEMNAEMLEDMEDSSDYEENENNSNYKPTTKPCYYNSKRPRPRRTATTARSIRTTTRRRRKRRIPLPPTSSSNVELSSDEEGDSAISAPASTMLLKKNND